MFPVGNCVCGCYMKSLRIRPKDFDKGDGHLITLFFVKGEDTITKFISAPPREEFSSDESYKTNKLEVVKNLENMMACYLTGQEIKNIVEQSKGLGLPVFVKFIKDALQAKKYWTQEVCIKTIPGKRGKVYVHNYTPFMKTPNETRWELDYDFLN